MRYADDVLASPDPRRRKVPQIPAERGLVVETADEGFCGAVVAVGKAVESGEKRDTVTLEDRNGRRRVFPMLPAAFLVDGKPATLVRPAARPEGTKPATRTASGSFAVAGAAARVARASRIWVEGVHDAELVERVWGDDLRVEGIVVERLDGADHLAHEVRTFGPAHDRRLGVLLDHLVAGSKEARLAAEASDPNVLVTGTPYVDVWQAVRPSALGIPAWPVVPKGTDWKTGVCAALGVDHPGALWRRILASVDDWKQLEQPFVAAVEQLIDFVTE